MGTSLALSPQPLAVPSASLADQTGAPPVQVIGDVWRLHGQFVDPDTDQPICLSRANLTPGGLFIQPAINATDALDGATGKVIVVDDTLGLVDFLVFPAAQTGLTRLSRGASVPALVRVQSFLVDALGYRQTFEILEIQPIDPKRTPLVDLVVPTMRFVAVAALNVLQFPEASVFWTEFKGQAIGVPTAGQSRASGAQEGITGPYTVFRVMVASDQPGTLTVVNEDDAALNEQFNVPAGRLITVDAPVFGRSYHSSFTPQSPATVSLRNGYCTK